MENPTGAETQPKPPRRRFRLSLRALMVVVLVLGVVLGWLVRRANVQREAVAAIRQTGGGISYDFQSPIGKPNNPRAEPNYPKWLVRLLGVDYFADVVAVLGGKESNDETMTHVGRLSMLRSFNAPLASKITDAGAAHLAGLAYLESVNLSGTKVTGATLANFRGMSRLKNISIIGQPVSDADLANLKGMTNLESIYLSRTQVTDAGLAHFDGMVNLKQLWLNSTPIQGPGLAHLKGMTRLAGVLLSQSQVRDLSSLPPLPGLTQLTLDDTSVGDADIPALLQLPALDNLSLTRTGITDAGLADLQGLKGLKSLSLIGTKITDASGPTLLKLNKLERLQLDDTKVTDATLEQLAGLAWLRYLGVRKTGVTDAGITRLKQAIPFLNLMQAAPSPRVPANRPPRNPGPQP